MAYKQFIAWAHKNEPLGLGNRVVIPSCTVIRIRGKFPEAGPENYEGFKDYVDSQDIK